MLSEKTAEVLKQFFLQREKFEQTATSMHPQDLAKALSEVLWLYANDKNSSTLREWCVPRIIAKFGVEEVNEE